MHFPATLPGEDPVFLWQLQGTLLDMAETLLWPRDATKTILPPVFTAQGPMVRNTPDLSGAFAELSFAARTYWPTVVYELGHETVHLLNPAAGNGNKLEEGLAVEFSLHAQKALEVPIFQQPLKGFYFDALQLVRTLPGGVFAAARQIKSHCGPLSAVRQQALLQMYPELGIATARRLCRQMARSKLQPAQPPVTSSASGLQGL